MNLRSKLKNGGQKRRAAGWTLLVLGLLVAGLWVASGWWSFEELRGTTHLKIARGDVIVVRYGGDGGVINPGPWARLQMWRHLLHTTLPPAPTTSWNLRTRVWETGGTGEWAIELSFWPLPFLLWIPTALFLRSGILARRRANTGMCGKCGYSLAGLAHGTACPECGVFQTGRSIA